MESEERRAPEDALTAQLGPAAKILRPTARAEVPQGGEDLDRFTLHCRQILASAAEQARQLGHREIRPEHILVAFLLDPDTELRRPLRGMLRLRSLQEALLDRLQAIEPVGLPGLVEPSELSDGCKQVLRHAVGEADRRNGAQVTPAHLLHGIVAEGSSLAGSAALTTLALRGLRAALGPGSWRPEPSATRDHVITFRVGDADLAAIDALVDTGALRTRSEASAWLVRAGIAANKDFFDQIHQVGDAITRLRQGVQRLVEQRIGGRARSQAD